MRANIHRKQIIYR